MRREVRDEAVDRQGARELRAAADLLQGQAPTAPVRRPCASRTTIQEERMTQVRRTLALLLGAMLASRSAGAAKVPPCDPARYLTPPGDHLIFGEQTPATTAVEITVGSVRIGCGTATKAKIRGTKK